MPDSHETNTWLRELLGAEPPIGVASLSSADQQRLATIVAQARKRQVDHLSQSFEVTANNVPRGMRRIVRKMLLR